MAKFNVKITPKEPDTKTYENAPAYSREPVQAWLNMLFSSFLENQYYESSKSQIQRFIELTEKVAEKYDYAFVGKAAIFARNELGMRSISQLTAAWLNDKSFQEKRNFYRGFMRRPDDVSEIFGAIDFLNGKRSHALIRGCADYLSSLGEYQIAKYKMAGRTYNMYDIVNLTHAHSAAIDKLKADTLKAPDTWEVNISTAKDQESRDMEWKRMVEQNKLGYMALIRNLNNILAVKDIDRDWIVKYLVPQIKDEQKIRKSLIFPYRLFTAYKSLNIRSGIVIQALEEAFLIATSNVPKFDGFSAVILDISGSMCSKVSDNSIIELKEIGACFAATLILNGSDVDFIKFGTSAKRRDFSKLEGAFSIIKKMCENEGLGFGTNIKPVMETMENFYYDRIFLISDMQVFDDNSMWTQRITLRWNDRYQNIMTYSFDLGNYSNQIEPPSDNFMFLTSMNDVFFKYISLVEGNENIVDIINNIKF